MGLFDRFKKRDDGSNTLPDVTPPVSDVLLRALLEGETITREKAMTLPAVSGAVDMISGSIASMPVKLYKVKGGKVEEVEGDPRTRLLNGDTGDTLDAYQMKKAMVEDYLMGKGGYCYIQKQRNEVTGLYYVEDRYITIWKTYSPIHKQYQIFVNGFDEAGREKNAGKFKPYDFIKLLRNTKDGASGIGLTVEISKELETAYQTLLYQLGMVKAGGNKRGFLKANRKLGQEEINALKTAWRNLYGNNTENVVVLNNGLEFQEASNSSVEMQMNESKRTLTEEINNLFHISNDFDMTFKLAIYPIVKAFETALNRDLLLEKEKKNYFFEFDVKEIIRANIKERYESYKLAKETGFLTINEIRRAENLNWIEGMDVINVGLGAVLYDTNIGKYFTPNTGETTDISEGNVDAMIEGHELEEAYDESGNSAERDLNTRYNDMHDEAGRFASKNGGGFSAGSGNEARIKELEKQLEETQGFFAKAKIYSDIEYLKSGFNGTKEEYLEDKRKKQEEKIAKAKADAEKRKQEEEKAKAEEEQAKQKQLEEELKTQPKQKVEQYKIIQETNPMNDDYHVGIRKPSDIKTWEEVVKEGSSDGDSFAWGDFSEADARKSLETGKITIYSSYPIKQGVFVSTSKIQAEQYAGGKGKKVYSKTIPTKEVAWINGDEGQYANTEEQQKGKTRDLNVRYNDAHDETGRFATKSGGSGGISSLANTQSWEDFKGNMRDRDKVQEMKEMGIQSPKAMRDYWVDQKMKSFTENDAKEISEEKAIGIIRENIGQNVLDGWFRDANSDYKERLETAILENKEVRNAGLNIAYRNWKESTGDTDTSFNDYVNTSVTMYRGEHGQETLSKDVFKSYTTDINVAKSFGNDVKEINVRPIDTLGSYQTTAESEYLVPVSLTDNK